MSTPEDSQLGFKDPEEALHHMTKDHFDMAYSLQLWVVRGIVIVMLRLRTSDMRSLATKLLGKSRFYAQPAAACSARRRMKLPRAKLKWIDALNYIASGNFEPSPRRRGA